jgi:hypothetical protein
MSEGRASFVASLWRKGVLEPYDVKELDVYGTDEVARLADASRLAREWAMVTFAAASGLRHPTRLQLKHGAKGVFIDQWGGF